jgi:hypothetical protein
MLMGVTSWELGVLRVPLIMVPDNDDMQISNKQDDIACNLIKRDMIEFYED